jgi:hypothetical protein
MTEWSLFERSVHNMDPTVISQEKSSTHAVSFDPGYHALIGYLLSAQVRLQNLFGKIRRMIKKWKCFIVLAAHSDIPPLFSYLTPRQRSVASCDFFVDTATYFFSASA